MSLGMMSVSFDGLVESGKIPPFYYCIEGVVLFASNIHRERASDGLKYIEYRWITLLPEQTSGYRTQYNIQACTNNTLIIANGHTICTPFHMYRLLYIASVAMNLLVSAWSKCTPVLTPRI